MDIELKREIQGLRGDIEMTKLAVESMQRDMERMLKGEMGEDIDAVLSGERVVKATRSEKAKFRISSWLRRFFSMF